MNEADRQNELSPNTGEMEDGFLIHPFVTIASLYVMKLRALTV